MSKSTSPKPWVIFSIAGAGIAATVGVSLATWWWAGEPGSAFPSWLVAWATVLGVGAAIVAGFYAARAFSLETQRDRRWEDQQRAAQAELIGAWAGDLTMGYSKASEYDAMSGAVGQVVEGAAASLLNTSPLPVFEVSVRYLLVLPNSNRDPRELGEMHLSYLPPSSKQVTVYLDISDDPYVPGKHEAEGSELKVVIRFVDAGGRSWLRTPTGRLVDPTRGFADVYGEQ